MADVARAAGVSVSTVSHVLNGTRKVSPLTERLVRQAIVATGYTGDRIARSMVTGSTQTIGLAMAVLSNPYFADLAHVIEGELAAAGYSLILVDTHNSPERELDVVRGLLGQRVDGIVLTPSGQNPTSTLDLLASNDVATVVIDRPVDAAVDQISVEGISATAHLVQHLVDHGHHRIAYIASPGTNQERLEGYKHGLMSAGLDYDPTIVAADGEGGGIQQGVIAVMSADPAPTAIVSASNQMTLAMMRHLRTLGLSIPKDVALVSFDDFEWTDLFHPRLTVIAQPTHQLASQAVAMLISRIHDPSLALRRVSLLPTFVHRDSCGCTP